MPTQPFPAGSAARLGPSPGGEYLLASQTLRFLRRSLAPFWILDPSGIHQHNPIRHRLGVVVLGSVRAVNPFVFIEDTQVALRVSNMVAIVMMFFCGWQVAKYVGYNKWKMSIAVILIGIMLVAVTIALGG